MPDAPLILVIDDDTELCELLAELLGQEGFRVESVNDGVSGLAKALSGAYAVVVLDVMLPGLTGFEVLSRLRRTSSIPVIMLTARGEDIDRIVGLEMGADDYLPKPFNPRELCARVRSVHRRAAGATAGAAAGASTPANVTLDDIEIVPSARRASVGGEELKLTTAEYDLLHLFVRNVGAVISREDLTKEVLGRRLSALDRAIDMHVSNLRKKLGPGASGAERIKTVRNQGYMFVRGGP